MSLMEPLDPYMSTIDVPPNDFTSSIWSYGIYNGKRYIIPATWDPDTLLFWNKDLFKAAGLTGAPTTWAKMMRDATKLDKIGKNGNIHQVGLLPWSGWAPNIIEFAYLYGATFPLKKVGNGLSVNVTQPGLTKALAFYQSFAKKYGVQNLLTSGFGGGAMMADMTPPSGTMSDPFVAGRMGMEVVGDWEVGILAQQAPNLHYGVAALPVPPGGTPYLAHSGWGWSIGRGAAHPQAAAALMHWLMEPANLAKWNLGFGSTPTRTSVLKEKAFVENPNYAAASAATKKLGDEDFVPHTGTGVTEVHYPDTNEFISTLVNQTQEVVSGGHAPQQAVAAAQQALDRFASQQ